MLIEFALFLAVLVVILVMIFSLTSDTKADYTDTSSNAYQALNQTENALIKIPGKLGILATAVIFSVILWVIMRVLPVRISGGVGAGM